MGRPSDVTQVAMFLASNFSYYVTGPSELASFERNTLLRTGDLAREKDGFYYITGRLKRMATIFGNRLNLDEVESLISSELNVQTRCAGYMDKLLLIFVIDPDIDLKELGRQVSASLYLHSTSIRAIHVQDIPLTVNRKVNYQKLIDQYETVDTF